MEIAKGNNVHSDDGIIVDVGFVDFMIGDDITCPFRSGVTNSHSVVMMPVKEPKSFLK